jgi:hypothetical protein
VIRNRLGRFATVLTAGSMALLLLGVGTASAATPGWGGSQAAAILGSVGPGKDAGFIVTLKNAGPGNISTLSLKADKAASYVSDSRCQMTPVLTCFFGAQNVGVEIVFRVAFTTGGAGSFTVNFSESTNGFASDKGGHSRGDINSFPGTVSVTNGGGNFDGGVNVGGDTYSDNQTVGRNNVQATKLEGAAALTPVTIQDGITSGIACNAAKCSNAFGEWSKLNVNNGQVFGAPFKVTLTIYGKSVPNGATAANIVVLHTLDDGVTTQTISADCSPSTGTPTNAECRTVTKVGTNYQIVVWLFENGGIRGGF